MEEKNERITKLVWYFTIFSILGLVIETLYCYITCNGKIESRKGLLIGPFCPIYGIGAIVIIALLNRYKKKPVKLFILGTILGAIIEYTLSYALEAMYGNRFWDYSYLNLSINGRISLIYSVFWGALSIIIIDYVKPAIDHFINKIKPKIGKKIEIGLTIFFIVDALLTVVAVYTYTNSDIGEQQTTNQANEDAQIDEKESTNENIQTNTQVEETENTQTEEAEDIQNNDAINIFYNQIMPIIFPNIRIKGQNGQEIWARDIMGRFSKHIKNYGKTILESFFLGLYKVILLPTT